MMAQERVIATAQAQVGYMGKRSNSQLDDFKANTSGKWNKYARDLDALVDLFNGKKNGYDWCALFVIWCFVQAFGRALAQKMLNIPDRSLAAGAGYAMNYYKQKGRFFSIPQPGDQIFFGDAKSTWHTGIVVKVEGGFVYTIEGNAGSPSAVRDCRYVVGGRNIKGYGRPDWSLVPADKPAPEAPPPELKPEIEKEDDDMVYYKYYDNIPEYYQDAILKVMSTGALIGEGKDKNGVPVLNVSKDLCRTLTVLDRLGVLG